MITLGKHDNFGLMPGRVFISCGQGRGEELRIAEEIAERLRKMRFKPYVALNAQSFQDINSGIISELRRTDYYVFVDLRRESIGCSHRGSLFTNQELAIATAFRLKRAVYFREEGVSLEGFAAYMASNAQVFAKEQRCEIPEMVQEKFEEFGWTPSYSRHLEPGMIHRSEGPTRTPRMAGRFFFVDVHNRREGDAAYGTIARLSGLQLEGRERRISPNKSPLKVAGQASSFQQVIWPKDHGAFDLFCVDQQEGTKVWLNNALDISPIPQLLNAPGCHLLHYQVIAAEFDVMEFTIALTLTENSEDAIAELHSPR